VVAAMKKSIKQSKVSANRRGRLIAPRRGSGN
jgi:hypothetical protein